MDNQEMTIKATIQVSKSPSEVFEAIVDPAKMSNYFIAEGSARMQSGSEVIWKFPEFEDRIPVRVKETIPDKYLSYTWDNPATEQLVEINLATASKGSGTVVTVTEKTVSGQPTLSWLRGNTEGWANFLACLKAYLEYGINLRTGAFDFMRK